MAKDLEPSRPVHEPWVEFDEANNNIEWEPMLEDTYSGSQAGGRCGPSNGTETVVRAGLASLFFFICPIKMFECIAVATDRYAYKEWVVPKSRQDNDGNVSKQPILVPWIRRDQRDKRPAEARHRADNSNFKPRITLAGRTIVESTTSTEMHLTEFQSHSFRMQCLVMHLTSCKGTSTLSTIVTAGKMASRDTIPCSRSDQFSIL